MKIHSDENGVHLRLTRVEKNLLRALPTGLSPRTGPRREVLKQLVAQEWPSPKDSADGTIGWFDETMSAAHWLSLQDIGPDRAAMLLCQLDPNRMTLEQAKGHKNEATGPDDFVRLLQRFEDQAKCEPQHRTLLHWLEFARASRLRHHPWIDEYVEAAGVAVVDADTSSEAPTPSDAVMPAEPRELEPVPWEPQEVSPDTGEDRPLEHWKMRGPAETARLDVGGATGADPVPAVAADAAREAATPGDVPETVNSPSVDRGARVKRKALIERNHRRWSTIERDLKDASENELSKQARATDHGYWWEGDALKWAEARHKLDAPAAPVNLASAVHRMVG